eukprot:13774615-Alexandrium_andersonii.AAC.1
MCIRDSPWRPGRGVDPVVAKLGVAGAPERTGATGAGADVPIAPRPERGKVRAAPERFMAGRFPGRRRRSSEGGRVR